MKTETKVTVATFAAALSTFLVWVLSTYVFKGDTPEAVVGLVAIVVPTAITYAAAWLAPHTPRPELGDLEDPEH